MELLEEDDLFLNLIRKRRLNKLWDVNEELHEVEIVKENNVLEKTFDDVLNMSGIHCHICNLEVPKMYIKEHNQTTTHQNLLKVTDEALERTRKHITNIETSNTTIKVENTYFCDICSRIVQNSEKEIHEKSNFHKKRETFNNLLSCFVDSYLNINEKKYDLKYNLDNDCDMKADTAEYEILLSEIEQEELQKELFKTLEPKHLQELLTIKDEELPSLVNVELTENKPQELNQSPNSTQELIEIPKLKKKAKKREKIKSYIEMINSKTPDKDYEIIFISKNQIKITALNKDTLVVPLQNFHSYNNKFCRVCLSEMEENHEISEDHIARIMTPVADKNCIREVDDIWSHCIVCNELTKTVASHIQSINHSTNLKKYYVIQFSRSVMMQTGNVQKETEDVQKQPEDQKELAMKMDATPQFDKFFKLIESKIDSLFPIFKKAVENENYSDDLDDFQLVGRKRKSNSPEVADKQHLNIKETNKSDIKNNNSDISQDLHQNINDISPKDPNVSQYCLVCHIKVPDFNTHKLSDSHKKMGKENKNRHRDLKKSMVRNNIIQDKSENSITCKCDLCQVNVDYDKSLIETHINTHTHRKNYLKYMEDNKIILIDDQDCHCEPCNARQARSNLFSHCASVQHIDKLKIHLNKYSKVGNEVQKHPPKKNAEKKTVAKTTDLTNVLYHFKDKDENVLCKTCYVYIPKENVRGIKEHVNSTEHCNKYNAIIKDNKIQINTNSFYCEICSVKILLGSEIDHVYSTSHRETLVLKSNRLQLLTSKAVIESVPKIQPKKVEPEKSKVVMIPLYIKHHFKKANKTDALCRVCEIIVPNSEITEHAVSFKHKFDFDILMFKNGIKIKDGNIYSCLTCENTMTRFNEMDHIFGKLHMKNLEGKTLNDLNKSNLKELTFDYISSIPGGDKLVQF